MSTEPLLELASLGLSKVFAMTQYIVTWSRRL